MADVLPFRKAVPDDAAARLQALDPRRSFLVEAPAGSGKTALLIQRFLTLLGEASVDGPDEVLAITFTRDATAELRDRVLRQLQMAHAGQEPADSLDRLVRPLAERVLRRDRELGWQLLTYPRRLNVQTIDAVCASIARSLPVLSGAGAGLVPAAEPGPLYAEAAHRTLGHLGGPDASLSSALEAILLHRDADLGNTESLIGSMLAVREQWAALVPLKPASLRDEALDAEVLPRFQKALDLAICRGLTGLSRALPADILQALCSFAAEMAHLDGYDGNPSPIAICRDRYHAPGERTEHLDHWRALIHLLLTGGGDFRKERGLNVRTAGFMLEAPHRKRLAAILDQLRGNDTIREALLAVRALPPAVYPAEQWAITKSLFRVLHRALAELQVVFAEQNACDFAELSLLARTALGKDAGGDDLALSTGARLQHLLIDEMQDTSSGQYELIGQLTRGWDGHSQTVFLVGDPKQSIYLFREARVERFLETMHRAQLGDVPLTVLHLTANFRSQSNLIDAFNEDFSLVFPPVPAEGLPAEPARIGYLPATSIKAATRPEPRHWHATEAGSPEARVEQTALDAAEMRRTIDAWRARPLPAGRTTPWRIAVLVRGRAHLAPVVAALRQEPAPVPYRAVNIEPLGEQQVILDLLALTRALLHPADRTAWLALLRSPLCGLSLDALHRLSGADDRSLLTTAILTLVETRAALLEPGDRKGLERFAAVMQAALRQRGNLRLSAWVHRTWLDFGADCVSTPDDLVNVQRFLELLDELSAATPEADDRLDLRLLTARLEKLYSAPSAAPDAVDLMTIHNSKGLEWDVVLVPSLERRAGGDQARLLSWLELDGDDDGAVHGLLAPIQARGEDAAALNTWMRSIQARREAAEVSRLFYVACTRAKEELHLYAATTRKQDGSLSAPSGTLLCAAMAAAEPHFLPASGSPGSSGADLIVFPGSLPLQHPAPGLLDRMAAAADRPKLFRIPLGLAPEAPVSRIAPVGQALSRPVGSYAVRAFGNTVHAFLERLTREIAGGREPDNLVRSLPERAPQVQAVLRASGLPLSECERLGEPVLHALRNTLEDPAGRWVLAAHPSAETEHSLRTADSKLRPDRMFLAGAEPLTFGDDALWIVDYKTAEPGGRDLALFLADEQARYAPQLRGYAAASAADRPIHLALYYPAIPRLIILE